MLPYLEDGLARARANGFDIAAAIANEYGESADSPQNAAHQTDIVTAAAEIATAAELAPEFFESTPKTVLLAGLGAAWVDLDRRKQQAPVCRQRLGQEADLLASLTMLLAGNESQLRRDILIASPWHREQFGESKMERELGRARDAFFARAYNHELSKRVAEVLDADGPGSILHEQRKIFNLTSETEQPFNVGVLDLATKEELVASGAESVLGEGITGDPDFIMRHESNRAEYDDRFSTKVTPYTADAFTRTLPTGESLLILYAPTAYSLLAHAKHGTLTSYQKAQLTIVRHEYGHTQKPFNFGRLGDTFEELKAQYPTGDKKAYWDSQEFFKAMGAVTGVDLRQMMLESLAEPNAPAAFMTKMANNAGLRNTLLMAASYPSVYTGMGAMRPAASMSCFREPQDKSLYDSLLREADVRRDDTVRTRAIGEWIALLHKFGPEARPGVVNIQRMRAESPHNVITYLARQKMRAARDHLGGSIL
ncbi:MAG TPA: hypothetical protein VLG11_05510 [Candidatus Saccharimonadales bacterium]|nr:hypothetical protein [Candidatus Saccharimonadales bacterium]